MWWARFLNVVVLHNHKTWQRLRLDHQREWTFDEWWDASLSRVPVTLLESGLARDCFKTQAKTKNTSIRIQSSSKWAFEVRSYKFRLTNLVKKYHMERERNFQSTARCGSTTWPVLNRLSHPNAQFALGKKTVRYTIWRFYHHMAAMSKVLVTFRKLWVVYSLTVRFKSNFHSSLSCGKSLS